MDLNHPIGGEAMTKYLLCLLLLAGSAALAETRSITLGGRELALDEVFYDDFSGGLGNWLPEGNATVSANQGWLEVDCGETGAVTLWCRTEFDGPQVVEYDFRLLADSRQSNVNMFLLAGNPDAAGIVSTTLSRDGSYGQYHEFPNYLVTVLNATTPGKREQLRVRLRLDPGFGLAGEAWHEPLIFGKVYHLAYLLEPPGLKVFLDGELIGEVTYGESYTRGLHGLRIWHTHTLYDNFRVSRVAGY
jgi:hypothetical protein